MNELSRDIIAEIRKIEVVTRRLVNQQMAGHYQSVFKGRGMSFDEVLIVQAMNRAPSIGMLPLELAKHMSKRLSKSGTDRNDFGGYVRVHGFWQSEESKASHGCSHGGNDGIFGDYKWRSRWLGCLTDRVERFVLSKKGRKHVLGLIDHILRLTPEGRKTNLDEVLNFIGRVQRRKAVVFLISDFLDDQFESTLSVTARRHDLIPLRIVDPLEMMLPSVGLLCLEDTETGTLHTIDTGREFGSIMKSDKSMEKNA